MVNVTGSCAKGISLANAKDVDIAGPLINRL